MTVPMYTHKCADCEKVVTITCTIAERDAARYCDCGGKLHRRMDRPGLVYAPTASKSGLK